MIRDFDRIHFDSQAEVIVVIQVLEKYLKAYPKERNNETIRQLYTLLNMMDMEW